MKSRVGYEYAAIRLAIEEATTEELEELHQILLKIDHLDKMMQKDSEVMSN